MVEVYVEWGKNCDTINHTNFVVFAVILNNTKTKLNKADAKRKISDNYEK